MNQETRLSSKSCRILQAVLAQGETDPTHKDISTAAEVGERTVSKLVSTLRSAGIVMGGRPLRLGPGLGLILGISVGMERLRAGLVDAEGHLYCEREEPFTEDQLQSSAKELVGRIRALGREVLAKGLDEERLRIDPAKRSLPLLGASISWPSPVDRDGRPAGNVLRHPDWSRVGPDLKRLPLVAWTAKAFAPSIEESRCHSLNCANADALAVAFDKARERAGEPEDDQWRVLLVVRIGGLLSAGTVTQGPHLKGRLSFVDARLISGTNGLAGEIGHLPLPRSVVDQRNRENPFPDLALLDYENARCCSGHLWHLDAFASGRAFVERLEASGYSFPEDPQEKAEVIRAAFDGELDIRQKHALQDVGRIIGGALASPILMLDPYSVSLTGSLGIETVGHGVMLEQAAWTSAIGETVSLDFKGGPEGVYSGVRGAALAVLRREVHRGYMDDGAWRKAPLEFDDRALERIGRKAPKLT
jgi:predicted NBD/HSP70 family sugar kinase